MAETLVRYMYGHYGRQLDVFQGRSYEVREHVPPLRAHSASHADRAPSSVWT